MTRIPVRRAGVALLLALAAVPVVAQEGWIALFRNTPAEKFDDEDIQLFIGATRQALSDATPEHGKVSWANPKTSNRGDVTVQQVFTWQQHPCRKLEILNEAKGRKGTKTMSLCQVEGKWRAVTASQLAKP